MPLFNFTFTPIHEIEPWGEEGNLYLSRFALTYGNYHMDIKGKKLFHYSDEIQNYNVYI